MTLLPPPAERLDYAAAALVVLAVVVGALSCLGLL